MEMTRITATEFQKSFGEMSDKALQEPVAITKQGRDHLVLLSAAEYARLMRRDRKVYKAGELPEEFRQALRKSIEEAERRGPDPLDDEWKGSTS